RRFIFSPQHERLVVTKGGRASVVLREGRRVFRIEHLPVAFVDTVMKQLVDDTRFAEVSIEPQEEQSK
ncbi:MAG: hypothetical protein KDB53_05115, partial [Planctomycetes bacterium]|nr:hypothetical protein [Planctomycetota bacterium]